MSATISQLTLETYFLKEISYAVKDSLDAKPKGVGEGKPVGLEITDLTTPIEGSEHDWRCELTVESSDDDGDGNPFYNFKIVMVGFFRTNTGLPFDQAKLLAESNCPAVLYSTSREIVATVTRRSPYPALLLPLVTFIKTPNEPKARKKSSAKKKSN